MNVFWERRSLTVGDIADAVAINPPLAYNSILTTLRILENKGFIAIPKEAAPSFTNC